MIASAGFLAGCNEKNPEQEARQRRFLEAEQRQQATAAANGQAAANLGTLGVDAAAFVQPIDPAAQAGDLRDEVARYTTLDSCVIARAKGLDPLLSDSLGALGYDTFLRDSCRMLEATKSEDAGACAPIVAGQLKERCQSWVGMVKASADICPLEGDQEDGRDPVCVAVASRNEHLCLAAPSDRREGCVALVTGVAMRCASAPHPDVCRREVERWRGLLHAHEPGDKPPAWTAPTAKLTLEGIDGTADPLHTTSVLASLAERGVVAVRQGANVTLALGSAGDLGLATTNYAPSSLGSPTASLRLAVRADSAATLDHFELVVPGAGILVVPGVRWDGVVKWTGDATTRASIVKVHVDGKIGVVPRAYHVTFDVQTYIRDVVDVP